MYEILRETTEWNCDYNVQNHTYLFNASGKVVAYAKASDNQLVQLKNPFRLDRRGRQFIKVKHLGLQSLFTKQADSPSLRKFKVRSGDKEYFVTYDGQTVNCTCTGFLYRGKCKHSDAVLKQIA